VTTLGAVLLGTGVVAAFVVYDTMKAKKTTPAASSGATGFQQLWDQASKLLGSVNGNPTPPSGDTYQGPPGGYGDAGDDYATDYQ